MIHFERQDFFWSKYVVIFLSQKNKLSDVNKIYNNISSGLNIVSFGQYYPFLSMNLLTWSYQLDYALKTFMVDMVSAPRLKCIWYPRKEEISSPMDALAFSQGLFY